MLEDTSWEEDIWEYKSKRKPKPRHSNNCSRNILESVEKATDEKYQSKQRGKERRATEGKGKPRNHGVRLEETDHQVSVGSSQNSSHSDETQPSQSKESPRKPRRTPQNKQVSPKVRPTYDGYCPSCQMPFSSLLGQTPRWHVFECLDSPPISDTECPEGLLCTSTIPSHYKKYTHLLLAQSRSSNEPPSGPSDVRAGHLPAAQTDSSSNREERRPVHLKTESLTKVLDDSLLMIQCLKTPWLPPETNGKVLSPSSQLSLVPRRAECVDKDKLVGGALPLAEEALNSPRGAQRLPPPENGSGGCEISYSPLQSDEETFHLDCELDDSQQELFFTQRSKESSLEDDDSATFEIFRDPSLKSLVSQAEFRGLYKGSARNASFRLLSQVESGLSQDDPYTDAGSFLPSPALTDGRAASNQTAKAKPGHPEEPHSRASSCQKQKTESAAVGNQVSLPLRPNAVPASLEKAGGERLPLPLSQSQIGGLQSKGLGAPIANSACACRKAGKPSSTPLNKSLSALPSSPKCNASQPKKVMKQMDIGVFFGLPPKRQEETPPKKRALERPDASPAVSPNEKRPRLCKRKTESSLSDLDCGPGGLNESQCSVQQPRKRRKKTDSSQGVYGRKSVHHDPDLGADSVNDSKAFVGRKHSRPPRGNRNTSEVPRARELRGTCPFYKRIPGTGFTVDAFQYGKVEGCTAYFLTHFHSDHYAGLSKDFTWPIYCSEITGNLLKKKLCIQEQYIHQLPMDTECIVDGVKVVLLDANHCPGATMILFHLPDGTVILHTGDFRADPSMERSLLAGRAVHTLYLDTTYCSPEYTFPSQQEVIQFAINTAFEAVTLNPRALVVCGTYCIGKEKVFLAIADVLGSKVGMSQEKYRTLQCLNIPEVNSLITTDMCSSLVHLLPMMQINFKGLQSHLKKCGGKYDQILAFRPTGWTHSNITSIEDITPQTKGNISIYGIPYSEHSSYLEMKRFVQWLKPKKIIPTVNVGTFKSRNTMEKYFKEWKLEAGY